MGTAKDDKKEAAIEKKRIAAEKKALKLVNAEVCTDSEVESVLNINGKHMLSTGCTLLNLGMSNKVNGGIVEGTFWNPIGESSSGKTFQAFTCMAEATINPHFANHRLIFDDVENANQFDMEELFGKKLVERLEPPRFKADGKTWDSSETIEDFRNNIHNMLANDEPIIYILDSFDALSSKDEIARTKESIKTDKEAGTYAMEKAKLCKSILRQIVKTLENTNSILIIISQTIDNIGGMTKSTRAGGKALKFFASYETWSDRVRDITKVIKDTLCVIGIESKVRIAKNKATGIAWKDLRIPIYFSYGMDDVGSMVDFLVKNNVWEKKKQTIEAFELDVKFTREKLIQHILNNDLEEDVKLVMQKTWDILLDGMRLKRKRRY